jgi:hypothetical protein
LSFGVVSGSSHPILTLPEQTKLVRLARSSEPLEWIGNVVETSTGWTIQASDLAADKLTGKTHLRMRSLSDRLAGLAVSQEWTGIHHVGVEYAMVSAVAGAELDLPFVFSFDLGEAEGLLFEQHHILSTVLTACQAFTVPSEADLRTVQRLLATTSPGFVVPPAISFEEFPDADVDPNLVGSWGVHGRESGLPTVLALAPTEEKSLLLLGSYEPAEMYEFSSALDHHLLSEKILRPGGLDERDCLARLRLCGHCVFPLLTSRQALYPLKALAAGARVTASRVNLLRDVPGLHMVDDDWQAALVSPWNHPRNDWQGRFSHAYVEKRWKEVYGTCS